MTSSTSTALLPTRALAALTTHLTNELALLDRLHYKGQSQHRNSLFWRRVEEVRRVANLALVAWHNLSQADAGGVDQTQQTRQKRLLVLLEKSHAALPKLHTSLTQLILLTHFLPLAVVLLGVTARLHGLVGALHEHVRSLWNAEGAGRRKLWKALVLPASSEERVARPRGKVQPKRGAAAGVPSLATLPLSTALSSAGSPSLELGEKISRSALPLLSGAGADPLVTLPPPTALVLDATAIWTYQSDSEDETDLTPVIAGRSAVQDSRPASSALPAPIVASAPPSLPTSPPTLSPAPTSIRSNTKERPPSKQPSAAPTAPLPPAPSVRPSSTSAALPMKRKLAPPPDASLEKFKLKKKKVVGSKASGGGGGKKDKIDDIFG